MAITLGPNRYGKAEVRVVRVERSGETHALRDLNVSVALSGEFAAVHLTGDNAAVLTTDAQKNTVYAFAREGVASPEDFGLRLAWHFVGSRPPVHRARVTVEEHAWERVPVTGHSFVRSGGPDGEVRTARVVHDAAATHVVSGLRGLTVLNTTGSEFRGFARDAYTTLAETGDRILATEVRAEWRHADPRNDGIDWDDSHARVRRLLLETFAGTYSRSLQQTLYAMGRRVLRECPELCEIRLALPNRHHFLVDLGPFGLDNPGEVFHAADRPYGLIEGTVLRDDVPPAEDAW